MGVLDDSEPLELFEIAIDRGDMDIRCPTVDISCELVGGAVSAGLDERADQLSPRGRDPVSPTAEHRQDVLDCRLDLARRQQRTHVQSIRLRRTYNNDRLARSSVLRYLRN
jgi:hypothetical protein